MGRELKRVPLSFIWPLNKVWGGYLNPFYTQRVDCPACDGTGYGLAAKRFKEEWYGEQTFDPVAYGAKPLTVDHPAVIACAKSNIERSPDYFGTGQAAINRESTRLFELWRWQWSHHLIQADVDALVAAERLSDFTRRPRTEEQAAALAEAGGYWMKEPNGYMPTAEEVNVWSLGGFGHDAINASVCIGARCEREGFETECPICKGKAEIWPSAEIEKAHEDWKKTHPPKGDGFQLWTTTNEGAPISPVFQTIEALCDWCADNATTFAKHKASAEKWREMLEEDFVRHESGNMVFL